MTVDEPKEYGGDDSGPMPTELLLASVASCFTIATAHCARKRSIVFRDLSVTVTGTYDGPRFRAIEIDCRIDCDPAQVDALVRAAERVCYVTNTLRHGVEISMRASAASA